MPNLKSINDTILTIKNTTGTTQWKALLADKPLSGFRKRENQYPSISNLFKDIDLNEIPDTINQANLKTPTEKLLYAALWKNGDILKISHIINGLKGKEDTQATAMTFHHFGKFLANPEENPIIDQHVIRAYVAVAFEGLLDDNSLQKISKRGLLNSKTDTETAKAYINWVKAQHAKSPKDNRIDLFNAIDDVMFAFGRMLKGNAKTE
jgi:hypothetical protein